MPDKILDIIKLFLEFLRHPTGFSVVVVIVLALVLGYLTPLVVVTYTSWDNTNRLEKAISMLGERCLSRNVALRPARPLSE